MLKWTVWQVPFLSSPGGPKLFDLPAYSIVEQTSILGDLSCVVRDGKTGYVFTVALEDYNREFPAGLVRTLNPTSNPHDAEQDIVLYGQTQYNLCGEFSVCFATQFQGAIEDFLSLWKPKAPTIYNRVFSGGRSRPTGISDLQSMLSTIGFVGLDLASVLKRAFPRDSRYTPGRLKEALLQGPVIAGCRIDGITGRLRGSGVGHWVVVQEVVPDRANSGFVVIYNPFCNSYERYSWQEFINSAQIPFGLVVKRETSN